MHQQEKFFSFEFIKQEGEASKTLPEGYPTPHVKRMIKHSGTR